ILGFFLKVQVGVWGITHSLAMHALAAGGMGMMVAGMMARVSLGHTGRNVNEPSRLTPAVFFLVAAAGVLRVLGPLFAPDYYLYWIGTSQLVWTLAFALFSILYIPMLIKPRIDGMRG
ncbi:MAG: NnrS family protein, partial [Azovibrio sp.]